MPPAGPSTSGASSPGKGLSAKMGPLPLWAWLIVAGVGVYIFLRSRSSSSTPSTSTSLPATTGQATTNSATGMPTYSTIPAWEQAAAGGLIAQGYDPSLVESTLGNYVNGNPLTTQQEGLLSVLLGQYGPPPGGAIAPVAGQGTGITIPSPTPAPSPTSPATPSIPYPVTTVATETPSTAPVPFWEQFGGLANTIQAGVTARQQAGTPGGTLIVQGENAPAPPLVTLSGS